MVAIFSKLLKRQKNREQSKTVIYHQDAKDTDIIWNAKQENRYLCL